MPEFPCCLPAARHTQVPQGGYHNSGNFVLASAAHLQLVARHPLSVMVASRSRPPRSPPRMLHAALLSSAFLPPGFPLLSPIPGFLTLDLIPASPPSSSSSPSSSHAALP
ncbi:hypothetical protein GN244_ATG16620 [Phytophthora infestans]|uniref:Uncharacterized protein n=1 Tax=Phytophthora infestans TaxID=4787 RepID=A0A833SI93_PHYIN|nr:hypothetical protein GN244_ATG16620 [Phytophthora infestans]KAF4139711.1 hypothetical protein GN958_ATG11196 [Phytophthora infestans]